MQRPSAVLRRIVRLVEAVYDKVPELSRIVVMAGQARQFPDDRDWAYCEKRPNGEVRIVLAPDFDALGADNQEGVLRHELAHAVEFLLGPSRVFKRWRNVAKTAEQRADDLARELWGQRINYDVDCIQTIGRGAHPRPTHLPR